MTDTQTFTTHAPAERKRTDRAPTEARDMAIAAARLINDSRCEDVLIYDVKGLSQVTDFVLIASGTSDRQLRSVAHEVADLARAHGFGTYGSDNDVASRWLVVDLVDVMVHLFEPATRGHYDLEMMWGDAPKVPWRRPTPAAPPS